MQTVRFPTYRNYEATRQAANNSMLALLAGSRLAAHTLQLTEGSGALLPTIFPHVAHINRFNLTTESARELLVDADEHLGAVAVPYALAVHEDFIVTSLAMLKEAGITVQTQKKQIRAWNMHEILFRTCNASAPKPAIDHFHLLRHMRNSHIHSAGRVSTDLEDLVAGLSVDSIDAWEKLTGRAPASVISTGLVSFGATDIFAAFAVTKELGRHANRVLAHTLPREVWADAAVDDYVSTTPRIPNSQHWIRGLEGYARIWYAPLTLSNAELYAAARRRGAWTDSTTKEKGGSSC
jgi:hypothetical protein